MSRNSCSVPQEKGRRISRFRTLLSTENIKIFSESQAFLAYSFFGQQLKVKPAIALYSSPLKYQASASRGKIARKFNFMFAFSACLYFRFKRIVEKLEILRHFALERIEAVESVVISTTNN